MRVSTHEPLDARRAQVRDMLQFISDYGNLDLRTMLDRLDNDHALVEAIEAVMMGHTGMWNTFTGVRDFCLLHLYGTPTPYLQYLNEARPRAQLQHASPYDVPIAMVKSFLPQRYRSTFEPGRLRVFTHQTMLAQGGLRTADTPPIRDWSMLTHVWVRPTYAIAPRKVSITLIEQGLNQVIIENLDIFTLDVPRPWLQIVERLAQYQITITDNMWEQRNSTQGYFVGLEGWAYRE